MKVEQMTGRTGRGIPNQFIIKEDINEMSGNAVEYFQSYSVIIAKRDKFRADIKSRKIWLDKKYWNYSKTTSKYRNEFLGMTTKEIEQKIKTGEIELVDLNDNQ